MEPKKTLMNTRLEDITVGDYLKLSAGAVIVAVIIPATALAVVSINQKIDAWKTSRKEKKNQNDPNPEN